MSGIRHTEGSCIMPDEKRYIAKALEESIENTKKIIKTTKERIKIDKFEQDKNNMQAIRARVGFTRECK